MDWQANATSCIDKINGWTELINSKTTTTNILESKSVELVRSFANLIEEADVDLLPESTTNIDKQTRQVQFLWSIEALDLSLLIRDAFLKLTRKHISELGKFRLENDSKENDFSISEEIRLVLADAATSTANLLYDIAENKESSDSQWLHQNRPNKEVISQLEQLAKQIEIIFSSNKEIEQLVPALTNFREHLLDYTNARLVQLRYLSGLLNDAQISIKSLPKECEKSDLLQLAKSIQRVSEQIDLQKANEFNLKSFQSKFGELRIPVFSRGGEMIYKEINFDKDLEVWIDSEIVPKILDADSDINILYDSSNITLFNTRNKIENLSLTDKVNYQFDSGKFNESIEKIHLDVNTYLADLDKIIAEINIRAQEQLDIDVLYDPKRSFLPPISFISMTKLTGQKLWYETSFWEDWKTKLNDLIKRQRIPYLYNLTEDPFHYVDTRLIDENDLDANSLFLKKGYIGRSFFIERQKPLQLFDKAYERWREGYQGSVLLAGKYGAGKTSFIEFLAQQYPERRFVSIKKGKEIEFNGRKHQISDSLGETLIFLAKQSIAQPCIICIDDIELWQYTEGGFYDSIRDLVDAIAKYNKRLFFLISTNHHALHQIERMFNFKSRFSETIVLDRMSSTQIANAIVIRHNASLKDFKSDENASLHQKAISISRLNRNNIGASLLDWERYLEGQEIHRNIPLSFSEIVNQHQMVLRIILAHRHVKESYLRTGLTASDNNFITEEIRKLLGYKILIRKKHGYLQIHPFIVFDVEQSLSKIKNQ